MESTGVTSTGRIPSSLRESIFRQAINLASSARRTAQTSGTLQIKADHQKEVAVAFIRYVTLIKALSCLHAGSLSKSANNVTGLLPITSSLKSPSSVTIALATGEHWKFENKSEMLHLVEVFEAGRRVDGARRVLIAENLFYTDIPTARKYFNSVVARTGNSPLSVLANAIQEKVSPMTSDIDLSLNKVVANAQTVDAIFTNFFNELSTYGRKTFDEAFESKREQYREMHREIERRTSEQLLRFKNDFSQSSEMRAHRALFYYFQVRTQPINAPNVEKVLFDELTAIPSVVNSLSKTLPFYTPEERKHIYRILPDEFLSARQLLIRQMSADLNFLSDGVCLASTQVKMLFLNQTPESIQLELAAQLSPEDAKSLYHAASTTRRLLIRSEKRESRLRD